jgi:hypothetical protein
MGSPDPMGGLKDLSHLHILTLLAHARDVAKTSQEVIYGLIQSTPAQWIENGRVFLHNVLRALKDSTSLFWEVLYRHDTGECSHRPLNQMWISINGERTTRRCKVCARPTTKKCQGLHNKRCCARYCGKRTSTSRLAGPQNILFGNRSRTMQHHPHRHLHHHLQQLQLYDRY